MRAYPTVELINMIKWLGQNQIWEREGNDAVKRPKALTSAKICSGHKKKKITTKELVLKAVVNWKSSTHKPLSHTPQPAIGSAKMLQQAIHIIGLDSENL